MIDCWHQEKRAASPYSKSTRYNIFRFLYDRREEWPLWLGPLNLLRQ